MKRDSAVVLRRRLVQGIAAMYTGLPFIADASGGSASGAAPSTGSLGAWADVWVVLSLPELASLSRDQWAEREALRQRIVAQQDQVMARLRGLGAVELARVQLLRNALAVRLPLAQMQAARALPGVRSVGAVRHIDRPPPTPPAI